METFSKREQDVIKFLLQGKSNKQIALALGVSQSTVEYHLKNVYRKLQVSSRTEAVLRLGKSTGDSITNELGKSIVEIDDQPTNNGGASISHRRFPMKNLYYLLGAGLLLGILVIILFVPRGQATVSLMTTFPAQVETQPLDKNTSIPPITKPSSSIDVTAIAVPSSNNTQLKGVVIVKNSNEQHYYLSDLNSSEMTLLDIPFNNRGIALSPNGQMIAYMPNTSRGLYLLDLNARISTPLLVDTGIGLAWSTDNETLAFSCRVQGTIGFSLCLVNIKDPQNVQVLVKSEILGAADPVDGVFSPSWSIDNSKITFLAVKSVPPAGAGEKSIPRRDIWLFDVSTQRAQKIFDDETDGISYIFQPIFLPDENAILFSGRKEQFNSVFKYEIDSKQSQDLTQTGNSFDLTDFILSPDEKTFLGQSPLSNNPSQYVPTLYSLGGQQLEQLDSLKNLQVISWSIP